MMDISDIHQLSNPQLRECTARAFNNCISNHSLDRITFLLPDSVKDQDITDHHHPVPELFLQLKGHSTLRGTTQAVQLKRGQCLIIAPKVAHVEHKSVGSVNIVCKPMGRILLFHWSKGLPDRQMDFRHDCIALGDYQSPASNLIDACQLAEDKAEPALLVALIRSAFSLFTYLLQRMTDIETPRPALLQECQRVALLQLSNPDLTLQNLAGHCGCHPDHLSRLARQHWGMSLQSWLTQMRMERARMLLSSAKTSIAEVAYQSGYADPHYFSRMFKKTFQQTPTNYRASLCEASNG